MWYTAVQLLNPRDEVTDALLYLSRAGTVAVAASLPLSLILCYSRCWLSNARTCLMTFQSALFAVKFSFAERAVVEFYDASIYAVVYLSRRSGVFQPGFGPDSRRSCYMFGPFLVQESWRSSCYVMAPTGCDRIWLRCWDLLPTCRLPEVVESDLIAYRGALQPRIGERDIYLFHIYSDIQQNIVIKLTNSVSGI